MNPGRPDQTFAYKILREDLFELFIEQNFVWEVRLIDPEVEARVTELDQYLSARGLGHRLDKLLDCGYRAGPDIRQTKLERLAERRIRKGLLGDWEAEVRRFSVSLPRQLSHFRRSSCSCSPTAEARRRERRQCGCESCHEHHSRSKA